MNLSLDKQSKNSSARSQSRQGIFLLAFGVVFISTLVIATIYYSNQFLSHPSASPGLNIVPLFQVTTFLTVFAFLLTQALLFYLAFKFRSRKKHKATYLPGNIKLELIWTIIPTLAFIGLFFWGQHLWNKINEAPKGDPVMIEIIAQQFNWHARYAGRDKKLGRYSFKFITDKNIMGLDPADSNSMDDFIPLQMHVPKNRPVVLLLHSKDVIHSFYIPSFGAKMDAVPGMTTTMHFTALHTTAEMREKLNNPEFNYEVACAELCGKMHFAMKLILVVDEEDEFDNWYKNQNN
jgi:cytochrome c oxidase subunit 2